LHPTLRTITISCTNFEADIPAAADLLKAKRKSTALQSLTLIECNIYLSLLDFILQLPKELKELSLGERIYIFRSCIPTEQPLTADPHFLDVLQHQASSLEILKHIGGRVALRDARETNLESASKLRNLKNLRHLDLGRESCLVKYLVLGGCPPSLEYIRFSDDTLHSFTRADETHVEWILKQSYEIAIAKIHQTINVDICFTHTINQRMLLYEAWNLHAPEPNGRAHVYKLAKAMRERGARLRISAPRFPTPRIFIPPYMYGEDMPVEEVAYDSERFWVFNGVDFQPVDDEEGKEKTVEHVSTETTNPLLQDET
jgi:hypothetical protein